MVSGCALWPISEGECGVASWEQRGYADGFGGHPPQYLRLARECKRFGVEVREAEYLEGWQAGYDEWYRLMGSIGVD
jgi:hypothetical protein